MAMQRTSAASLVLLPLALLMAALGWWQIQRMEAREALIQEFENAPNLTLEEALRQENRFARISATGRFDTRRHVLLDNMVLNGLPGVHVYTPFTTFSGTTILVNRGWKPMAADRRSLPEIWTPTVPVGIRGMLAPPPEHRQKLGEPDNLTTEGWPQLVTYLDLAAVASALQVQLPGRIVRLAEDDPAGFEGGDWSPAVLTPERHLAYAVQWFALAVVALAFALILSYRARARFRARGTQE
jgi:surfeit locus 1 family protein